MYAERLKYLMRLREALLLISQSNLPIPFKYTDKALKKVQEGLDEITDKNRILLSRIIGK
jgi:hypothetical protein